VKKLCIIKTGSAPEPVKKRFGDFEDMILRKSGISAKLSQVYPVYQNKTLPLLEETAAVIITGSKAMVTDPLDWSVLVSKWLVAIAEKGVPVLGICYGHQLIAQTFGGVVDYNRNGEEIGKIQVSLTGKATFDPLFKAMPNVFSSFAKHFQSVVKLPQDAVLIARNNFEPHHAFSLFGYIWGVQFHPEFTADIMRSYIDFDKKRLLCEGRNVKTLYDEINEDNSGEVLLRQFVELIY
jgi:GMP synthase (glutamine-hydrolysing)